jgi:hypothetical protein
MSFSGAKNKEKYLKGRNTQPQFHSPDCNGKHFARTGINLVLVKERPLEAPFAN